MLDLHLSEKLPSDLVEKLVTVESAEEKIDEIIKASWHLRNINQEQAIWLAEFALKKSIVSNYAFGVAESLFKKAAIEFHLGKIEAAKKNGHEALRVFEQINRPNGIAAAHNLLGNCYSESSEFKKSLHHLNMSLRIREEQGNKEMAARAKSNLSTLYLNLGQYDRALEYALSTQLTFSEIEDKRSITVTAAMIADIYYKLKDDSNTLRYSELALKNVDVKNDTALYAGILSNYGLYLTYQKQFDAALEALLQSKRIFSELNIRFNLAKTLANLAFLYSEMGDESESSCHYFEALSLFEKNEENHHKAAIFFSFAQSLFNFSKIQESKQYAIQCRELSELVQCKSESCNAHELLSKIFETENDHAQALFHFKRYHALKEQVFNEESDWRLKNLQVLHDVEQARLKERESIRSKLHSDVLSAIVRIHRWSAPLCEALDDLPETLRDSVELIYETSKSLDVKVRHFQFGLSEKAKSVYEVCKHLEKLSREILEDIARLDVLGIGQEMREAEMAADARDALVDIVQLAMTNIWKHAGAAQVTLQFAITGEGFEMNIRDDGKGFNVDDAPAIGGVSDMKMLAEQVGAKLKMTSTLQTPVNSGGTRVFFSLPLTSRKGTQTFSE